MNVDAHLRRFRKANLATQRRGTRGQDKDPFHVPHLSTRPAPRGEIHLHRNHPGKYTERPSGRQTGVTRAAASRTLGPEHPTEGGHVTVRRHLLRSKLHRATVTQVDAAYEGSITIDQDLLDAADIAVYERVLVANVANGARFETYAIAAPSGSGTIGFNGAAAHLGKSGDPVIIMAFAEVEESEVGALRPRIILVGPENRSHRIG